MDLKLFSLNLLGVLRSLLQPFALILNVESIHTSKPVTDRLRYSLC